MAKPVEYEVTWSYRDATDKDQIDRTTHVKATNAFRAGSKAITLIMDDFCVDRRDVVVTDINRVNP